MLMNKFTAFEDAAMLNMHGLSNTVHGVGKGGGRGRERRDKDGGEVEGRKEGKMERRSGNPCSSSLNFPFLPFRLSSLFLFLSSTHLSTPLLLLSSPSLFFPSLSPPLIGQNFFVHGHMKTENILVEVL